MRSKTRRIISAVSTIGFLLCVAALFYPVISSAWNTHLAAQVVTGYQQTTQSEGQASLDAMFADAKSYNAQMGVPGLQVVTEKEYETDDTYENLLNPDNTGMMGYIEIPCIDVTEAIYHYSTEDVLAEGVGHIHGSSLPVGGKNTRCVLTGHRGLPTQKFFTDLDKVQEGDRFYIHILGKTLAYKVTDIETVLPTEVDQLKIENGQDLVTLVTCTPYGVNTHRLLVTGSRIPYSGGTDSKGHVTTETHTKRIDPAVYAFAAFMMVLLIINVAEKVRQKKRW